MPTRTAARSPPPSRHAPATSRSRSNVCPTRAQRTGSRSGRRSCNPARRLAKREAWRERLCTGRHRRRPRAAQACRSTSRRASTSIACGHAVSKAEREVDTRDSRADDRLLRASGAWQPQPQREVQRRRIYRVPADLLVVDLGSVYPELSSLRLRGKLQGRRIVPYASRAEITTVIRCPATNWSWVDDPVDAFFLQIQGSGRVQFADGSMIRLAYGDQNGHPYRSIGRWLVDQGELTLDQASMESIKAWVARNPSRAKNLLDQNPSYVFFRELPLGDPNAGPVGALGVPLTRVIPWPPMRVIFRWAHRSSWRRRTRRLGRRADAPDARAGHRGSDPRPVALRFLLGVRSTAAGNIAGQPETRGQRVAAGAQGQSRLRHCCGADASSLFPCRSETLFDGFDRHRARRCGEPSAKMIVGVPLMPKSRPAPGSARAGSCSPPGRRTASCPGPCNPPMSRHDPWHTRSPSHFS